MCQSRNVGAVALPIPRLLRVAKSNQVPQSIYVQFVSPTYSTRLSIRSFVASGLSRNKMAGPAYLKIWTTVLHNSKLLPLTLSERGFYLWLLVMCKEQRDDGQVFCRSYAALGQNCGCDLRTARKILGKLSQVCLLTHTVDEGGMIVIEIPNYKEWQELEVKEVLQKTRQNAETLHSTTQNTQQQSRAEQSREKKTIPPSAPLAPKKKKEADPRIKVFIDYWFQDYGKVFPGEKYVVQGGKDAAAVKRLLGTAPLEDIEKAASWFLRLESNDWLGQLGKEISLFVMKYNEIRQRILSEKNQYARPPQ